jgi:NADH-quinone oxidoreductase subunit H
VSDLVAGPLLSQPYVQIPLRAVLVLAGVMLSTLPVLYAFLKIHSHIMSRVGPMYPGRFHGIGQPLAEAIKWIQKEDIIPARADKLVFVAAPLVVLVPVFLLFAAIPVSPHAAAASLDIGVFYIMAISSIVAIGVIMAAYSSFNKFTLLGGLRAVGQLIAYELPVVLAGVSVAMLAESLSFTGVVRAQHVPFLIWPLPFGPLAFVIFLLASLAEVVWAPFDMPAAESEIITGPYTEYSGMRFIFFYVAEFAHLIALAAIGTLLFLGGWRGPVLPPVLWFAIKTGALIFLFIWIRFTLPRLREDQLQKLAWKVLIPLGFLNVLGVAAYKVLT